MRGNARKQTGLRIARLRKSNGKSQQALAAAIGAHVNTVARWERSGIARGHPALPLIAAVLDCPLAELTGEEPEAGVSRWSAAKRGIVVSYL